MQTLNRLCVALAFALGGVLMLLGVGGLFFGTSANFTLPPVAGGIPLLFGWGIVFSARAGWQQLRTVPASQDEIESPSRPHVAPGVYIEEVGEHDRDSADDRDHSGDRGSRE